MIPNSLNASTRFAIGCIVIALLVLSYGQAHATDRGYKALEGVDHLQVVFDVTTGSPLAAPVALEAIKETYTVDSVN